MNHYVILLEEIFHCTNDYPHQNKRNRRFSQQLAPASTELDLFNIAQTKFKILLHDADIQAQPPLYLYILRILQMIPKSYEEMSKQLLIEKNTVLNL